MSPLLAFVVAVGSVLGGAGAIWGVLRGVAAVVEKGVVRFLERMLDRSEAIAAIEQRLDDIEAYINGKRVEGN